MPEQPKNARLLHDSTSNHSTPLGGRALRLFGISHRGNQRPIPDDPKEHELPEIMEPVILGEGILYQRHIRVPIGEPGIGDSLTFSETGMQAKIRMGEQTFGISLGHQGSKLTIQNTVHDSEGWLCGDVTWDYYPTQGRVEKKALTGRWGQLHPSKEDTRFGHYITDYTSDDATLRQILESAIAAKQ